jgi:hypothetical protein
LRSYPEIESLMGGWFHQDFDINGDTVEEVIGAYRKVTPRDEQKRLALEIQSFLGEAADVDAEFQDRFHPDVLPTGFAPTTRAFLEKILASLGFGPGQLE